MTLKVLSTVLITISIGISPGLTWNPNIHRYESYDLERGPVFYEAYYPDSGDETRGNYQEKRYLDRGAVVERSYQVPSDHLYPENALQADGYQSAGGRLLRANGYIDRGSLERSVHQTERVPLSRQDYKTLNNFPVYQRDSPRSEDEPGGVRFPDSRAEDPDSLDIREISSIARRAISRDLENWSMLENYLDRVKYQNQRPSYQGTASRPDNHPGGFNPIERPVHGGESLKGVYGEARTGRFYEEMPDDDSSRFQGRIELPEEQQRSQGVMGKSTGNGNTFEAFDRTGYQDQIRDRNTPESPDETPAELNGSLLRMPNSRNPQAAPPAVDSYPGENIFEPRPQVINYVFSKKSNPSPDNTVQSVPAPRETLPRNYGDNLIQEEIKKTEETSGKENKDVSITSIKVSEEPRHKTRHHHGEWPKRDYSHRRQP